VRDNVLTGYFRAIDRTIHRYLVGRSLPLVLAGTDAYIHAYNAVCQYPLLVRENVVGTFSPHEVTRLHTFVRPVALAWFRGVDRSAVKAFDRYLSVGRTVTTLEKVTAAAEHGRVKRLYLQEGRHMWGTRDRNTGAIIHHVEQLDGHDDDLLDDVAEAVVAHRGDVVILPRAFMPQRSMAAAVLRW
jgi:hypothetical protein